MNRKKIVAMIPCRLGSQRIPKKNLRLLGGKTIAQWVANACLQSECFDEIYINSESTIFEKMALDVGVKFYKRPEIHASNSATNDDFGLDFIQNVKCDILVQVNPTSPFTTKEDLRTFVKMFVDGNFETLHTVKNEQIETLMDGMPLNFDPLKPMPRSQDLVPVKVFTSSIMAWDTNRFKQNMTELGCAVYGGKGKIGYYTLRGISTIDIDNEFDFTLAEFVVETLNRGANKDVQYYK